MKTTLSFLALGAALFAGHAMAATAARLPAAPAATESGDQIVLIDSDDDEEGGKGNGWIFAFGGDDDDDDDEGTACATGTDAANPQGCTPANAPMADPNAPPPANGLFGGAQPPKAQIN